MKPILLLAGLACLAFAGPSNAAINVFACEPEWAALATEIGGTDVTVFTATTPRQDPHQIQARPALIARLRQADLILCTGADLEVGWMPMLQRQAANPQTRPGQPGYLEATAGMTLLDRPPRLDRADGDIHAAGNPHIHLDPRRIRQVAAAVAARMAELDPAAAPRYAGRHHAFDSAWEAAIEGWQKQAAPLRGVKVAVYHKDWTYLLDWLGMIEAATIEPKPGVPPGTGHLAGLIEDLPRRDVKMILYAAYQNSRGAEFLAEKTGIPTVMLPFTVGGSEAAVTLSGLFDDTIRRLLAGFEGRR